jgi:hypothetical protein
MSAITAAHGSAAIQKMKSHCTLGRRGAATAAAIGTRRLASGRRTDRASPVDALARTAVRNDVTHDR